MQHRLAIGLVLSLMGLVVGGCGGGPAYHKFDGSTGFSDTLLRPDDFEVSFAADSNVTSTQAKRLATVRAAEIALEHDKPFFEILEGRESARYDTVIAPGSSSINTTTTGGGTRSRSSWSTVNSTPGYEREYASPTVILIIRLQGQRSASTLDARDVLVRAQQDGIKLPEATADKLEGLEKPPKKKR